MTGLLARRLDAACRCLELTREVLDDGDAPWRIARRLAHPGGRLPCFRDQARGLNDDLFDDASRAPADSLPCRSKSCSVHPDAVGNDVDFVRLRTSCEEARFHCATRTHHGG